MVVGMRVVCMHMRVRCVVCMHMFVWVLLRVTKAEYAVCRDLSACVHACVRE